MCASDLLRKSCIGLLLLASTGLSTAQTSGRDQEQIRRLRLQVQQLQQQQAAGTAAQQKAQADLTEAQRKADALSAEATRLRQRLAQQDQAGAAAERALLTLRDEHERLRAAHVEQGGQLQSERRAIASLRADLVRQQAQAVVDRRAFQALTERHVAQASGLQTCAANNQALRQLGRELLQRYADKGVADVLAVNEPFLQTRRVALDNLVQGYEDKLDALALPAAQARSAP